MNVIPPRRRIVQRDREECERPLPVLVKEEHRDEGERLKVKQESIRQQEQKDVLGGKEKSGNGYDPLHEQEEKEQFVDETPENGVGDFTKRVMMPGTRVILFVKRLEGTVMGNSDIQTTVLATTNNPPAKPALGPIGNTLPPSVPPRRASMDIDFSLVPPPPKPGPAPILLPDGRIKCACGKMFSRIAWYERHGPTCALQRTFQCSVCNKVFRYNCHLRRHMETHTDGKSYLCDICGLVFKQDIHLYIHRRRHSSERPHKCKLCGDTFALPSYLQAHLRQHTRERPFQCETCGMCFMQSSHLRTHQRSHQQMLDENGHLLPDAHMCTYCGTTFAHASKLRRHSCKLRRRQRQPGNKPHTHDPYSVEKKDWIQRAKEEELEKGNGEEMDVIEEYMEKQAEEDYLQDMEEVEVEFLQDVEGDDVLDGSEVPQEMEDEYLQDMVEEYLQDEDYAVALNSVREDEDQQEEYMLDVEEVVEEKDEGYLQDIEEICEEQEEGRQGWQIKNIQGGDEKKGEKLETLEEEGQRQEQLAWEEGRGRGGNRVVEEEEEELEIKEEWIDERFEIEEEEETVEVR